jgi:hypothetical protein
MKTNLKRAVSLRWKVSLFTVATIMPAILVGGAVSAAERGGSGRAVTNSATATANARRTKDSDVSFDTDRMDGRRINVVNSAKSLSVSCTGCKAVAIAVQIVLAEGSVSSVVASNSALAENRDCTLCDTTALAYQFVIAPGTRDVWLTAQGRLALVSIEWRLRALAQSGKPGDQITNESNALISEVLYVLSTELRVSGQDHRIQIRRRQASQHPSDGSPQRSAAAPVDATDDSIVEVVVPGDGSGAGSGVQPPVVVVDPPTVVPPTKPPTPSSDDEGVAPRRGRPRR